MNTIIFVVGVTAMLLVAIMFIVDRIAGENRK